MDRICIKGNWYVAGSPEAMAQIDANGNGRGDEWDTYVHDLRDVYLKVSPVKDRNHASPTDYTLYSSSVKAGELFRTYILSDYRLNHSDHVTAVPTDQQDSWDHTRAILEGKWDGFAVKNQDEYHSEKDLCLQHGLKSPCYVRITPEYYAFRGIKIWGAGGVIIDNPKYPADTTCSWEALK